MLTDLPTLDALPRQSASDVKNRWRDVVRAVRQGGSVAVTNHSSVELVLVDAATYQQLTAGAAALKEREHAVLEQLAADFDKRLAVLQQADAARKVASVLGSRGKLVKRPRAGHAY